MEFQLDSTREEAVLAMIVQEAERVIKENKGDGYLGRTAMQKIPYFLQVCGVPVRYRFNVHHYGPFCSNILSDLDWMRVLNVIDDQSPRESRYSNYRLGEAAQSLIDEFEPELEEFRGTIRIVVEALYPWKPTQLELVSTLHYAYRELKAAGGRPDFTQIVQRFEEYKEGKFENQDIEGMLSKMEKAGLVSFV